MSSNSSHHPQEVLLVRFSLHVHKGDLNPYSFHFIWWAMKVMACVLSSRISYSKHLVNIANGDPAGNKNNSQILCFLRFFLLCVFY